ncbi:GNAT family N-acetyltransferase [Micromonospora carbonacea]|uniref:GNAT family N-acetyltransferase n=1 Tax=Micromonospora carbonacea TaxID=47853 RepID=A0A7H8XTJ7_9ACTN|nr:GNAT family N-acetyltransferase [Micromonospora carbonacea]MBB5823990.1 RimJ/RimL family protein N-acetyltransferase [Micromonospora carbonacea]QLD27748.1 GNAT family N-acetyltransferase [Micromonospora carbonacea]
MTGVTGVDGSGAVLLETGRLRLRRFTGADADALTELDADPEVMRYLTGGRPTPAEVVRGELLPHLLAGYDRHPGLGRWAAVDRATGMFLGWFALDAPEGGVRPGAGALEAEPPPGAGAPQAGPPPGPAAAGARPAAVAAGARPAPGANQAELGYRLRRAAWGRGLATEGSRALLRHAFATVGLARVWAQTMAVNTPSRRVMEKAGLRYVRTFHLDWDDPIEGTEHGEVEYELLRAEWAAREAG